MRTTHQSTPVFYLLATLTLVMSARALGQRAAITGGVNLRTGPGRVYAKVGQLTEGDTVALLDPSPTGGYYHVTASDNQNGWIWVERVSVLTQVVADTAPLGLVDSLAAWDKPEPSDSDMDACRAVGAGIAHVDSATDLKKNRVDTTDAYHTVPIETVLALPWEGLPTRRYRWSGDNIAAVARYEGVPITLEGYLAGAKEEGKEATNCELDTHDWHDWHVWLVPTKGEGTSRNRLRAIVVEVTPRVREFEPNWVIDSLKSFQQNGERVRISGWLMLDPDHPSEVGKTRGTIWEIHPVTRIEVFRNTVWEPLQ